jgi:coenzyme F420 hydrogenase subunit beta
VHRLQPTPVAGIEAESSPSMMQPDILRARIRTMNGVQALSEMDVSAQATHRSFGLQQTKTFRDLQTDIIDQGLCTECGGCVSFCSAGRLNALEMGNDCLPRYTEEDRCISCGLCYAICPMTHELDTEIMARFGSGMPCWSSIASARATDRSIREVATDGGVVTALLLHMLDTAVIQGAIVSRRTSAVSRQPLMATSREDLISAAGAQLSGTPHLEVLGDHYTTYSSGVPTIRELGRMHYPFHVAMVGTPCQIRTLKKMQCLGIIPADLVTFTVGLFCTENFVFDARGRRRLQEKLGIQWGDIASFGVKSDVRIELRDGSDLHIPFEEMKEFARPACLACTDYANEYADLSAGGLGSPHGYTTTIARTEKGNRVYGDALKQGYIEEKIYDRWEDLRLDKRRISDEVTAFAQWKRERGERWLSESGR